MMFMIGKACGGEAKKEPMKQRIYLNKIKVQETINIILAPYCSCLQLILLGIGVAPTYGRTN